MSRNASTGTSGLTGISGGATTYSTGSAGFNYSINGKAYTKAQVSGGSTPTTDGNTGSTITLLANQGNVVLWGVNSSGTVSVYAGTIQALDSAGNFIHAPDFPSLSDSVAPFAYTVHKAGSTLSGTFTFGTSNWNTTGMTHVAVSIMEIPTRPQVS